MKITSGLLDDTLNLIQLARETALAKGNEEQANRLSPVVNDLKNLVATSRDPSAAKSTGGLMEQNDFKTLLNAAKVEPAQKSSGPTPAERNKMVMAMSAGNMSDIDIARQLGMTREEVRMIVSVGRKGGAL
jgi:hypothetical protein